MLHPFALPTFISRPVLLVSLIASFMLLSCNQPVATSKNSSIFTDSVLLVADDWLNHGRAAEVPELINSSSHRFAADGTIALWKKYAFMNNYYLHYSVNPAKSTTYLDSMFAVLAGKEDQYKKQYTQSLFTKGDVLMAQKQYAEAYCQYYDGRVYVHQQLDTCSYADFTNSLALIRYRQGQFRQAIPLLKQALSEIRHCGESSGFYESFIQPQSMLNTLALCYEQTRDYDSAAYYYKNALSFINSRQKIFPEKADYMQMATAVIYGNLGRVYAVGGDHQLAVSYYRKSIAINDRPGFDPLDALGVKIELASLLLQEGKLDDAGAMIRPIDSVISGLDSMNADHRVRMLGAYKVAYKYYQHRKDLPRTFYYFSKFHRVKDSLQVAKLHMNQADMDGIFAAKTQEQRIRLISRNDQLKSWLLVGTIITTLLIAGFLISVTYHMRRYRKINSKLNDKNTDMQKTLHALEASQQENTRMMKIVAHDLRNPIGAISMAVSLIERKNNTEPNDRDLLDMIKRSANSSLSLVNELLQVHTKEEHVRKSPEDIAQLLQYCIDTLQHKAVIKNQRIVLQAQSLIIPINREKIWRVASNLIANAIKFSPDGGDIKLTLRPENSGALITVSDHGIGIPDEMKDKLFDLFTDTRRTGTAGEESFGLGLAICKQIVEAHGGNIWAESETGNGTTFFVWLPGTDSSRI